MSQIQKLTEEWIKPYENILVVKWGIQVVWLNISAGTPNDPIKNKAAQIPDN